MNVVWQSALPPTLGAICFSVLYIQYYASACEVSVSHFSCSDFLGRLVHGSSLAQLLLILSPNLNSG